MKTKKLLLIMSFLSGTLYCSAQTLSPSVISPAGSFTSGSGGSLSSTTGEMTMVATFTSGSVVVTQGFQQADNEFVGVEHLPNDDYTVTVGPNPTSGQLNVYFKSIQSTKINFRFIDAKGVIVFTTVVEKAESNNFIAFDLTNLVSGNYILEGTISDSKGKTNQFSKKFTLIK